MITLIRVTLIAAACLGFAVDSSAVPISYTAMLDGPSENPPIPSSGVGTAMVVIDTTAHTLLVDVTFSGLIGATTAAHIHAPAVPPANAGVATQTPSFVAFPIGVSSGSYTSPVFDLTLASSWNPSFITFAGGTTADAELALAQSLAAGQAYFNIHTNFAPGGEIRGFFAATTNAQGVPEPGTAGLVLLGLLAATCRRKRQR